MEKAPAEAQTMSPTVGSLFSGIGGLDLGLERAGWEVRWQAENDPYCSRVLTKHWPAVPNLGDVTKVDWSDVERVDLICGGFPCQPVSEAGLQRAQDDVRWLWPEVARCVGVLRPRLVLVENVSGLLTANDGRAMGDVLGDLAQLGYDAEWSLVSACSVGAPHTRDRVFLVAYPDRGGQQAGGQSRDGNGAAMAPRRARGEHIYPVAFIGSGEGRTTWATEPDVCRLADGLSDELDRSRLRALGNAVVPQVSEFIGRQLLDALS